MNNLIQKEKKIENELLNIVLNSISQNINDPVLVLSGKNWHEGIIGIVAARIKEKFNKPTIIISFKDGIGKASARSITSFDIGSVILSAVQNNILIKGGGHKMAGGFSIYENKINEFKNFILKRFEKDINKHAKKNNLYLDSLITTSAINFEFYKKIDILSPFGSGNPEPKFTLENLSIIKSSVVGEKHIKTLLSGKDGTVIKAISFNSIDTDLGQFLLNNKSKKINVAGKLSLNEWNGEKMWSLLSMIFLLLESKKLGPIVYRLGHMVFIHERGVRFLLGPPKAS